MRHFRQLFLVGLLLVSVNGFIYAQDEGILKGWVKDIYDKVAIEDAHVILEDLNVGTSTNSKGAFVFSGIPKGTYTLTIRHIGYFDHSIEVVVGREGNEQNILLSPRIVQIDPVTVTATLNKRKLSDMPARVALVPSRQVEQIPANNIDDLLKRAANVNVHRPWGIFSKSASVTMRGLPGSARTLILLDGVPMNKVAGGAVNWNFIEPYDVEDIEIVKGPSSAIYGNNAMTGVVNIKTKKPDKNFQGNVRAFGGSLGTFGGAFNLGGLDLNRGSGLYWKLNGFGRKGDGYVIEPEETRDTLDSKVKLEEYNAGLLLGYRIDSLNSVDVNYRFYFGRYGTGTQIFEAEGSYDQFVSHLIQSSYDGRIGEFNMNARLYYQAEYFSQQNESMNSSGKYKLSDTESDKQDYGLWFNISRRYFRRHLFTTGFELKQGDLTAQQIYRTSTDEVYYGGMLSFAGIFLQDEYQITDKFSAILGLRFDYARFTDGYQDVEDPTSNTGFIRDVKLNFTESYWNQLSPKLALQYRATRKLGIYASVNTGFMPPKIDDMSRSGKISKGFKIANPELKPERLLNYELGATWKAHEKLSVEPSVYYSRGYDFQYFVATGDSVETGGADLKPVLQRQNIARVGIAGAEITVLWKVLRNISLSANYTYNNSEILEFEDAGNPDKDISGNGLIEVPQHMANASFIWQNKIVNTVFDWHFLGKEWYDDENTQYIKAHHIFDIKFTRKLPRGIGFSLTVQNIFNDLTLDRKGTLPPGRFVMFELLYEF